ncbi:hypothetical protein PYW08_004826 [Mythimna loreyi]|uniref:Uncharacterized protein n=1 Tax=Mythimna loreyi TaxID=667449 RepID=A0ACC2QHB9_9NEOP|nr:hypothetical protein PYW08_004826 [Mythimna loreyi]
MYSKRLNRQDPRHFFNLYVHLLVTATNNFKLDFYFYQFLSNRYKPSFVEMHFILCDMLQSDQIFGSALLSGLGGQRCPYPPGIYDLNNMTMPHVPKNFPFPKGRIYCNVSLTEGDVTKLVFYGNIDLEMDFYFYQFLSNRYKPSFVEMHFKLCDMMQSDQIFGSAMLKAAGGQRCPYPPAIYDLTNMTIPYVPKNFPFTKGRIYCNVSLTEGDVTTLVGYGSIDMEMDFYFYQFLSNRYKPSFVEMHFILCDMLQSDQIFGSALLSGLGGQRCPYPPGIYDLNNMTMPHVPKNFPFPKGRIYCNVSLTEGDVTKLVFYGNIDLEVKTWHKNKKN